MLEMKVEKVLDLSRDHYGDLTHTHINVDEELFRGPRAARRVFDKALQDGECVTADLGNQTPAFKTS